MLRSTIEAYRLEAGAQTSMAIRLELKGDSRASSPLLVKEGMESTQAPPSFGRLELSNAITMRNTRCRRSERAAATYSATPAGESTGSHSSNGIKTWIFFTFGFVFGASIVNLCAVRHLAMSNNMVPTVHMKPAATTGMGKNNGWRTINVFVGESDVLTAKANSQTRFSQCNQDKMVLALLGEKRQGYFIDLGANHAIRNSNTFALERHFGWSGICIEPNPMYWKGLANRDCHVAAAVVGNRTMESVEFLIDILNNKHHGRSSGIISTAANKSETKHESEAAEFQMTVKRKCTVPLLEILQQAGAPTDIDYLSMTGSQEMALVSFPFDTYKIKIVTVRRPTKSLNGLLQRNNFHFTGYLSCITTRKPDTGTSVQDDAGGETLWIHKSLVPRLNMNALKKMNIF